MRKQQKKSPEPVSRGGRAKAPFKTIFAHLWREPPVGQGLSKASPEACKIFLFCWTQHACTSAGIYSASPASLSFGCELSREGVIVAIEELERLDLVAYDWDREIVAVLPHLLHNQPTNGKHAQSIAYQIEILPPTPVVHTTLSYLTRHADYLNSFTVPILEALRDAAHIAWASDRPRQAGMQLTRHSAGLPASEAPAVEIPLSDGTTYPLTEHDVEDLRPFTAAGVDTLVELTAFATELGQLPHQARPHRGDLYKRAQAWLRKARASRPQSGRSVDDRVQAFLQEREAVGGAL